jgi:flagellar basal body P-ring formation protein FlgA
MHNDVNWQRPEWRARRDLHVGLAVAGFAAVLIAAPSHAQQALHDVAALAAQVRSFAGSAPRLDPRLVVPRCPAPALSWARDDVVRVDCAGPAWTLYVPVDQPAGLRAAAPVKPRPAIRRGETVMVEAAGPGFAVSIEAVAERDAEADRIALKGPAGRRFTGRIGPDGGVSLAR